MNERELKQFARALSMVYGTGAFDPDEKSLSGYRGQYVRPMSPAFSLEPEEDNFFGPIGEMVARMVPGLGTTGKDGEFSPVFKTNFRMQDSGMSGFSHLLAEQNKYSRAAADRSQKREMDRAWAGMFGDDSAVQKAIDASPMSDSQKAQAHRFASFMGSPMGSGIGQQLTNQLLGYDRGVSSGIMHNQSYRMAAGMGNYFGGNDGTGVHGQMFTNNEMGGLNMHMIDPFSRDFADTRASLASVGDAAVQRLMYDGYLKKGNMHGASETLVSQVLSDAMASGDLNEALGGNLGELVNEHKRTQRNIDSTTARKEEAQEKLKEAKERGDTKAQDKLEQEIKKYDDQLKVLEHDMDHLAQLVADAAEPLIEAVDGVVSSLKDFYGDETEAKRALDALTGGRGSKDRAVAERVNRQVDEIKMLGVMAGVDPSTMGAHLMDTLGNYSKSSGRGSSLGIESTANGYMALEMEKLFAKQIAGAGGDPRKQDEIMRAQQGYAKVAGKSQGDDFTTLLVAAKKNGAFEGREEDYEMLKQLATTGRNEDFQKAWNMLGTIGYGSVQGMQDFRKNRAAMAMAKAGFNDQESAEKAELFANMHVNEVGRMGVEGAYSAKDKQQIYGLTGAGLSKSAIDRQVGADDFDAIMSSLSEIGDDPGASTAKEAMQREYEAALEKFKNDPNREEKAKQAAANAYHTKHNKFLSSESRDTVRQASAEARSAALERQSNFTDENGNERNVRASKFMERIGAAGSDHKVSRAAMSAVSKNMFAFLNENKSIVKDKNGNALDPRALAKEQKEINKLIEEGKGEEAAARIEKLRAGLDESSQAMLDAGIGKGNKAYRTTDTIRNEKETKGYLDELMKNKEIAKKMNGMSEDDRFLYAKYHRELTAAVDPKQKEQIMENMKALEKKAEENAKGDGTKLVDAIQSGDMQKFMEIFKNGNVTMEQFFDSIKKIIGMMGGAVVSDTEMASAEEFGAFKRGDGRKEFLDNNTITMANRFDIQDEKQAKAYLEAVRGGDVRDKDVRRYMERLEKAKKGDKGQYKKVLAFEDELLGDSEKELGKESKKLDKSIRREKDPEKKKSLEEQKRRLEEQISSVKEYRSRQEEYKNSGSEKENAFSSSTEESFKDSATETVRSIEERKKSIEEQKKMQSSGLSDETGNMSRLIGVMETLVSVMKGNHADAIGP